ncbi:zinc finger domain-containing protein [Streptomyces umbrinus]|uniref:zinc finger domain-containing protein n=1 Tax=Streptomyces umbrinus TaxID=67370 RepID=UPI003447B8CE
MADPKRERAITAVENSSAAKWRGVSFHDNREPATTRSPLKLGTAEDPCCWCGELYGHYWPGKDDGASHPRDTGRTAMTATPNQSPRTVACPPAPKGCGALVGEPCTSHRGTRERHDFHQARTAAWTTSRIDANPAVRLILDAAKTRRGMHGKHAAELLDGHGYTAEAECIRRAVSDRNGLMSAKQAAALLLDRDQPTETAGPDNSELAEREENGDCE